MVQAPERVVESFSAALGGALARSVDHWVGHAASRYACNGVKWRRRVLRDLACIEGKRPK